MKAGLDTNVLVYAEGVDGEAMRSAALSVLAAIPRQRLVVPVQALAELQAVLVRKARWTTRDAQSAVLRWQDMLVIAETSAATLSGALTIAADHGLRIWDAIMIAAASGAGCRMLLTQDMQPGFTWGGVTIVDPFARASDPLLDALIAARS